MSGIAKGVATRDATLLRAHNATAQSNAKLETLGSDAATDLI